MYLIIRHDGSYPGEILRFSKGNISRLVLALAESHRRNLTAAYQVDFLETLYGLARSNLAVAILPQLDTTYCVFER